MLVMLENINSPQDLKKLKKEDLKNLCEEIRNVLLNKIYTTGGHLGSNLAMIEAIVALHYVFNSPIDKFVFDVSHQSYTHKILTGRKDAFIDPSKFGTVSGYTTPNESEHDFFKVGHTSTAVALATGLAKGRDLLNEKENIVAIMGDGALSGGEALEALDNAVLLKSNFIVVLNDNEMSIPENTGGIYSNLKLLRETNGKAEVNIFKAIGYDYIYVEEGNDVEVLVDTFKSVLDIDHPVLIHIHTLKGKGDEFATLNKEAGHYVMGRNFKVDPNQETYKKILKEKLLEHKDGIIVINASTPTAAGLSKDDRKVLGDHFLDVGICEPFAVALSSGIARRGYKPVYLVSSSFVQRCYDQLNQDLAMNNTPALIVVYDAGIYGGDCTHVGQYDIPLISNIPNIKCFAPSSAEDLKELLEFGFKEKEFPMVVRLEIAKVTHSNQNSFNKSNPFKYKVIESGKEVALIGLGSYLEKAKRVKEILSTKGINATLIDPVCYSDLDKSTLTSLLDNHKVVATLENGSLEGGLGEKIASFYGDKNVKVLNFGGEKDFNDLVPSKELFAKLGLNEEDIVKKILGCL